MDWMLSVVIPAYNEASRLPATLISVQEFLEERFGRYEILVVDDGSQDDTAAVVLGLLPQFPGLRLLSKGPNRGKGYATKQGVMAAAGDWVLCLDADGALPIDNLTQFVPLLEQADILIGSKHVPGSRAEPALGLRRRLMSRGFGLAVRALVVRGFYDTQCGFKLYRRDVAKRLFADLQTERFAFDVEILARAKRLGLRVRELPVHWLATESSRVRWVFDPFNMLVDLVRIRYRVRA